MDAAHDNEIKDLLLKQSIINDAEMIANTYLDFRVLLPEQFRFLLSLLLVEPNNF